MYGIFCILLMAGLIFLTVLHLRRPSPSTAKWLPAAEWILFLTGLLLHPILLFALWIRLNRSAWEADFVSWAWDAVMTYWQYALPALGIFLGITGLCALLSRFEKAYRSPLWTRMRSVCALSSSTLLLTLAGFFGAMTQTEELALEVYVYLLGIAGALTMRGIYPAEYSPSSSAEKK